ncbi:MAG: hypothetical protein AB1758_05735, partial [Candidatus Eremiobacterota bacterium]
QETATDGARLQRELGQDPSYLEAVTAGLDALGRHRSGFVTGEVATHLAAHTVLSEAGPTPDESTLGKAFASLYKASGDERLSDHASRMSAVGKAILQQLER